MSYTMGILPNKAPSKFSRYQDPTGEFDNTQLQQAAWFAKHRLGIRKGVIIVLSVWCVLTVGFSLFFWLKYLVLDVWRDTDQLAAQTTEFQDFTLTRAQYTATPLAVGQTQVFQSNTNKYDLVTPITNPNDRFIVRVDYQYEFAGTSTTPASVILMPGQRVPLTARGVASSRGMPSGGRLIILDKTWKRISAHVIPDIERYLEERRNFVIRDFAFAPNNEAEGFLANQVSFLMENNSVYSFWDVPIVVEFLRNNTVVGVSATTLAQYNAGEARLVDLRYVGELPFVDAVRVTPTLNIFDPSVYIDLGR